MIKLEQHQENEAMLKWGRFSPMFNSIDIVTSKEMRILDMDVD